MGLSSLNQALERVKTNITVTLRMQPFELNPQMWPGGQDIGEHLTEKYGSTPEQQKQIRDMIRERGAAVGFEFNPDGRGRIYNTFNAHRLLHWAGEEHPSRQAALKMALLVACHRDSKVMDDPTVLLEAAMSAGLDGARAGDILNSDEFTQEVREQQAYYRQAGINSVPAVVINERHLVSGGQPVDVYEQALRQIAADSEQLAG